MADNKAPNNQQNIDQLHSIQQNLFGITDQYKKWNKEAATNSSTTKQAVTDTTRLNRVIQESLNLYAKTGKELINQKQVARVIRDLQGEARKALQAYHSTYRSLTTLQQKSLDTLIEEQDRQAAMKKGYDQMLSDEIEAKLKQDQLAQSIDDLESKGLINTKEHLDLMNQFDSITNHIYDTEKKRKALGEEEEVLNNKIKKIYKDEATATAVLRKEQAEAAESTLNILKTLPQAVQEGNRTIRKNRFWQELFSRVPVLDQFSDSVKHMEDFGAKGAIVLGVVGAIGAAIYKIVEMMFKADTQVTNIQKQFGVTRAQAEQVRQEFFEIANNAEKFAKLQEGTLLTQEDIYEAQLEFNKAFGTAIVMSGQQLAQLAKVKDVIDLSEEAMKGLMTYSLGTDKAMDSIDRTVLGASKIMQLQKGVQLDNKAILEEVFKVTGGIRANFKGNVEELSKAVTQSKLYGTNLQEIQHTSDSLLDFESSIENQLEAELLTGKQINLERARAAALIGDMNTVMQEMVNEAGSYDQFMKMNVITQNSLAKAFGFTRDEMSDMLFQQKALEGLRKAGNREEQKSLTERYEDLVKLGKTHDELVQALGEAAESSLAQQSAQQKFQKVIERVEEIIGRLFDGGMLERVATWIGGIVNHLSQGGSIFGILTGSEAYEKAKADVAKQIGVHDSVISPKGAIMISTPRGQIAADPNDSVITTTNPQGLLNGRSTSSDNRALEAKLDKVIDLLSKGGNVYLDGKKVGTTMALGYNATL